MGAINNLTKYIRSKPNDSKAYDFRGVSRYFLKYFMGAISDFNRAVELNPGLANGYQRRGLA